MGRTLENEDSFFCPANKPSLFGGQTKGLWSGVSGQGGSVGVLRLVSIGRLPETTRGDWELRRGVEGRVLTTNQEWKTDTTNEPASLDFRGVRENGT